jgi:catechol 2,3-dioxygenase-like lactoylglutathione lyase family enzyme
MPTNGTQSEPLVTVTGLDHIGLRVRDVESSLGFYTDVLGLESERVNEWRNGDVTFPSVRLDSSTLIDLFAASDGGEPTANNQDHFCLEIEPIDLANLKTKCIKLGIGIHNGPGSRWGARGDGTSLYIYDPDNNVVELKFY